MGDGLKKSVTVELWDNNKAPVCPTLNRAKRSQKGGVTFPVTSRGYVWHPKQAVTPV